MNTGEIDFNEIISGSSNIGIFTFDENKYRFEVDKENCLIKSWSGGIHPINKEEIENRIVALMQIFFKDCEVK